MVFSLRSISHQEISNNIYLEQTEALKNFFIKKYRRIYKKRFFVKVNVKDRRPDKTVRSNIYKYQLKLMADWYNKWSFMMDQAMRLRIRERLLYGYRCNFCKILYDKKKRQKFYMEGYWYDELNDCPKIDQFSEEEVYNECQNMYFYKGANRRKNSVGSNYEKCYEKCKSETENIFSNRLQEVAIGDYLYMLHRAMKELDDLHNKLTEELDREKECDDIIYGLIQIKKLIREGGLEGKRYKRLEKIVSESFKNLDLQNISDAVEEIYEQLRGILEEEKDDHVARKRLLIFCDNEIEKYKSWIKFEKNQKTIDSFKNHCEKEHEEGVCKVSFNVEDLA